LNNFSQTKMIKFFLIYLLFQKLNIFVPEIKNLISISKLSSTQGKNLTISKAKKTFVKFTENYRTMFSTQHTHPKAEVFISVEGGVNTII